MKDWKLCYFEGDKDNGDKRYINSDYPDGVHIFVEEDNTVFVGVPSYIWDSGDAEVKSFEDAVKLLEALVF